MRRFQIMLVAVSAALLLAMPAAAQPSQPVSLIDPYAITHFDPAGGNGIALTPDLVRAYLAKPVSRPTDAQISAASSRLRAAKAARDKTMDQDDIFAPLWDERAFELKDGSKRPMTDAEKAVFDELDAAQHQVDALNAANMLSYASESVRQTYAEALCGLLANGVTFASFDMKGYRKLDGDWRRFGGWRDTPAGKEAIMLPVNDKTEIALLKYELAQHALDDQNRMFTMSKMILGQQATPASVTR